MRSKIKSSRWAAALAISVMCLGSTGALAAGASAHRGAVQPAVQVTTPGLPAGLVGTYNFTLNVTLGAHGCVVAPVTWTGTITLKSDGSWTSFLGAVSTYFNPGGSWLKSGSTIALSDVFTFCQVPTHGGTYMAKVTKNATTGKFSFGSASAPGILNSPYNLRGTWYATQQ